MRRRSQWTVNFDAYSSQLHPGGITHGLHYLDLSCNALTDACISEVTARRLFFDRLADTKTHVAPAQCIRLE